jgi:hypothetical protein
MDEGELEIGQGVTTIRKIMPAKEIVEEIWNEFLIAKNEVANL